MVPSTGWGTWTAGAAQSRWLVQWDAEGKPRDVHGQLLELPQELAWGVPHPLEFLPQREAWIQALAGQLQPFE